jgi:glycosyltransferase involved in cell wall biosynthesis
MKIAIYTIALNEEQFVDPWYESAKEADYLLIADTGSTDNTVALAKKRGITVTDVFVKPWRFDIARNAALAALPADVDYCIALDMDEVLLPGWRAELENALEHGWTRPRYQYTWNWNEDGTPGLTYGGDKIHTRHGYRWKHPVHEVAVSYGGFEEVQGWVALEIHHHADNTKTRSQYFPLLKMAVDEDPYDDRNAFYYARELYFHGMYEEATKEFKRHLDLPRAKWPPERAASMRYLGKINKDEAERWFIRAIEQAPGRREPWVDLSKHYYEAQDWEKCYESALTALEIKEKPLEYLCEAEAWGAAPHDYAAISAYNLKKYGEAAVHGHKAVELNPSEQRLHNNLAYYEEGLRTFVITSSS